MPASGSACSQVSTSALPDPAGGCAQALLWFGIKRSKRAPTKMHPYGYMRDKFVFSLISAVGIFCLGAGVSVWNGVSGLMAATPVEHVGWSIAGTLRHHVKLVGLVLACSQCWPAAIMFTGARLQRHTCD